MSAHIDRRERGDKPGNAVRCEPGSIGKSYPTERVPVHGSSPITGPAGGRQSISRLTPPKRIG